MRFWEKEFKLTIARNTAGSRRYTKEAVDKLLYLNQLIKVQGFTMYGAKRMLGDTLAHNSFQTRVNRVMNDLFDEEFVKRYKLSLLAFAVQLKNEGLITNG